MYAFKERYLYAVSENGIVYYAKTYCFGDKGFKSKNFVKFLLNEHLLR